MSGKLINRRNFMKSTLVSVTGFPLLASGVLKQEEKVEEKGGKKRKFIYRTLGKTGIKLPVIGMGGMYAIDPALFRAALDSGINHLETAHMHMAGKNEEMIGEVIKGRPRDSYFISTKIWFPHNKITGTLSPEAKEETFLKMVDISLKRLGLDYVDFLCLHGGMSRQITLHETVLNSMEKAKKDGKVRFVGVSTHRNEPEVIQACTDSKFYDFVMPSYNFKQKHYLEVKEAIARAAQAGLGIVAMKVMGGTGPRSDILRPVNASAALKWVLQDPNVHTTIPGFTSFDHINIDLAVMEDLTPTDSEKDYLQKEASIPGLYCQGCGQCVKQCFAKLPIPDLMRAYMYTYGYRKPAFAQELVVSLGLPRQVCEDCSSCPVKCSIGFEVPRKIRDVARLRDVPAEFITV
jgi:predicted aldo/keto reductase-like oxidoreductase